MILDSMNLAAAERKIIMAALQFDGWDAASLLGVSPGRLEALKKKHKIVWPDKPVRGRAKAKQAVKAKLAVKAKPAKAPAKTSRKK